MQREQWQGASVSPHNKPALSSALPQWGRKRLQSLCYVTWENENIRGLSVGIQDGKGATSSNPHVNTEAKPGWIKQRQTILAKTQKHVQMELIATSGFSGTMTVNGTVNMGALFNFSSQNRLRRTLSSNTRSTSHRHTYSTSESLHLV